ncbi:hypothetical protein MUK42_37738, partial [Musa troglodytarum]
QAAVDQPDLGFLFEASDDELGLRRRPTSAARHPSRRSPTRASGLARSGGSTTATCPGTKGSSSGSGRRSGRRRTTGWCSTAGCLITPTWCPTGRPTSRIYRGGRRRSRPSDDSPDAFVLPSTFLLFFSISFEERQAVVVKHRKKKMKKEDASERFRMRFRRPKSIFRFLFRQRRFIIDLLMDIHPTVQNWGSR